MTEDQGTAVILILIIMSGLLSAICHRVWDRDQR